MTGNLIKDINQADIEANLPTLTTYHEGYTFFATDTQKYYRWNGSAWDLLADANATAYTDENAQDAVGAMLANTDTVVLGYDDSTPELTADVQIQMSIISDGSGLKLDGDEASPGNDQVYGTDGSGNKGWKPDPAGGGGLTQAYIGYNTVGGSWETLTTRRVYLKKVTLASATQFTSIDVYLRPSTDNVTGLRVMILTDNAGSPDVLIAQGSGTRDGDIYLSNSSSMPGAGRWLSIPIGVYLPAGDYWIGFISSNTILDVAYDGSGSDKYFTASIFVATGAYPSAWTINTSSNKYSIRAGTIS